MRSSKIKRFTIALILITILLLYISFLAIDLNSLYKNNISDKLKYISILLCFILSLLIHEDGLSFRDALLLQLGLLFTSLADLFFLILNSCTLGVVTFCLVQIIYCIRYLPKKVYSTIIGFITFIVVTAISFLVLSLFSKAIMVLFMVALIYAVCLITSLIRAIKACKRREFPSPNRYMIVVGMVLFALCDINVGLSYLASELMEKWLFLDKWEDIFCFLVWFFYVPSQVLLGWSGYDFRKLFRKY